MVSFLTDCLEVIGDQPKDPGEKKSVILASISLINVDMGGFTPDVKEWGLKMFYPQTFFDGNHTR